MQFAGTGFSKNRVYQNPLYSKKFEVKSMVKKLETLQLIASMDKAFKKTNKPVWNDLAERIKLHNNGHGAKYLRGKGPIKLVYAKEHRYYKNVLAAERSVKQLRRSEKEELVRLYAKNK